MHLDFSRVMVVVTTHSLDTIKLEQVCSYRVSSAFYKAGVLDGFSDAFRNGHP